LKGNYHARPTPHGTMAGPEILKERAGIAACAFISDGMSIGLGTGSTVKYSIIEIARMIKQDGLKIRGVPTSEETKKLATSLGIPLIGLHDAANLDITIDGADEFDPKFDLIKGGGGALTREKIVALASNSMVVVADSSKQVGALGAFPLPIEVDRLLWREAMSEISEFCPGSVILRGGEHNPYITDNDGLILDCSFGPTISEPSTMEPRLSSIAGVVEVGLFVGICDAVVMATADGLETLLRTDGRLN